MRRVSILVVVIAAVTAIGCKKKGDKAAGEAATAPDMPTEFASWMPADATAAWQGAWVSRLSLMRKGQTSMSMAGDPVAFEFTGSKVKMFDGETEATLDYTVHTPCEIEIVQPAPDMGKGATYRHNKQFVIVAGHVQAADGEAGYRKGKTAIACVIGANGGTYTLDDKGTCVQWTHMFHWDKKPATCVWSTDKGKDLLTIGTGEWTSKLYADGDVLESEQFTDSLKHGLHEHATDFAAAKAKVIAMDKENPVTAAGKGAKLVEQATAAGGKVGETSTVPSLYATFGSNKAALLGKPAELTGYYVMTTTMSSSSNGVNTVTYDAQISGDAKTADMTVDCVTKTENPGFAKGDKVTVKGTVGESFDKPQLADCSVAKAP